VRVDQRRHAVLLVKHGLAALAVGDQKLGHVTLGAVGVIANVKLLGLPAGKVQILTPHLLRRPVRLPQGQREAGLDRCPGGVAHLQQCLACRGQGRHETQVLRRNGHVARRGAYYHVVDEQRAAGEQLEDHDDLLRAGCKLRIPGVGGPASRGSEGSSFGTEWASVPLGPHEVLAVRDQHGLSGGISLSPIAAGHQERLGLQLGDLYRPGERAVDGLAGADLDAQAAALHPAGDGGDLAVDIDRPGASRPVFGYPGLVGVLEPPIDHQVARQGRRGACQHCCAEHGRCQPHSASCPSRVVECCAKEERRLPAST